MTGPRYFAEVHEKPPRPLTKARRVQLALKDVRSSRGHLKNVLGLHKCSDIEQTFVRRRLAYLADEESALAAFLGELGETEGVR